MAMKTVMWALVVFWLVQTAPLTGQESPLKWPVPGAKPSAGAMTTATVDLDWITASLGQPGTVLLDVRDARGWDRWETPRTFAAGHIPHALPFDPQSFLLKDGSLPDPAEVRRRFGTLGPRPGDPVSLDSTFVLYGEDTGDSRPGLGQRLLASAGLDARVFPGGWREWTEGGSRPTVRILSAQDLAALLKREDPRLAREHRASGLILLDLREGRDFAIGHLPGAASLPFALFAETFEKRVAEGWPGADRSRLPLVLYCYGPECIRSREAGAQAARLGFRDVIWFRGGVREWLAAGYPLLDSPLPTAAPAPRSPDVPDVPRPPGGASPGRAAARP